MTSCGVWFRQTFVLSKVLNYILYHYYKRYFWVHTGFGLGLCFFFFFGTAKWKTATYRSWDVGRYTQLLSSHNVNPRKKRLPKDRGSYAFFRQVFCSEFVFAETLRRHFCKESLSKMYNEKNVHFTKTAEKLEVILQAASLFLAHLLHIYSLTYFQETKTNALTQILVNYLFNCSLLHLWGFMIQGAKCLQLPWIS